MKLAGTLALTSLSILNKLSTKPFLAPLEFRVKNRDFSAIFGGFDFIANYLEMNRII